MNPGKMIILALSISIMISCNGVSRLGNENYPTGDFLWTDSAEVLTSISLSDSAPLPSPSISTSSRSISRASVETNKIYFRSSDIEFWSINSESDLNSIFSRKYNVAGGFAAGESLEYYLGDNSESVTFSPYNDFTITLGNGLNPNWDSRTADFISAGKTIINLVRLDIGAGQVTFVIDGHERDVRHADGGDANGINANSIFFIDEQFLSKPVLVTRDIERQIHENELSASDLKLTDQEFSFISTLFNNNNSVDSVSMIDVNGALCIPLTPVDISSFDASANTLRIDLSWNIANAIHVRDGEYFMDNRVGKTSFNFEVSLIVE